MTDNEIKSFMQILCDKDEHQGYMAMSFLIKESQTNSTKIYHYMDLFFKMLDHSNPSLRSRGLAMIECCIEFDSKSTIEKNLKKLLMLSNDPSPIVARECLKMLPKVAKSTPSISATVTKWLLMTDLSVYEGSFQNFMSNELCTAIREIESYKSINNEVLFTRSENDYPKLQNTL